MQRKSRSEGTGTGRASRRSEQTHSMADSDEKGKAGAGGEDMAFESSAFEALERAKQLKEHMNTLNGRIVELEGEKEEGQLIIKELKEQISQKDAEADRDKRRIKRLEYFTWIFMSQSVSHRYLILLMLL